MEIGPADTTGAHAHSNLPGAGDGEGAFCRQQRVRVDRPWFIDREDPHHHRRHPRAVRNRSHRSAQSTSGSPEKSSPSPEGEVVRPFRALVAPSTINGERKESIHDIDKAP
jgi:hypothetical protein